MSRKITPLWLLGSLILAGCHTSAGWMYTNTFPGPKTGQQVIVRYQDQEQAEGPYAHYFLDLFSVTSNPKGGRLPFVEEGRLVRTIGVSPPYRHTLQLTVGRRTAPSVPDLNRLVFVVDDRSFSLEDPAPTYLGASRHQRTFGSAYYPVGEELLDALTVAKTVSIQTATTLHRLTTAEVARLNDGIPLLRGLPDDLPGGWTRVRPDR